MEYKQLLAVDTECNRILFGVPASTHVKSFQAVIWPILQDALHKMVAKNPTGKYPLLKYGGELLTFTVSCMYVSHVPHEMSKDLKEQFKKCIHFKICTSDSEIFSNVFKYMGLSRLDKKFFGKLA